MSIATHAPRRTHQETVAAFPHWWDDWWRQHLKRHGATAPDGGGPAELLQREDIGRLFVDLAITQNEAEALSLRMSCEKPTRQNHVRLLLELARSLADRRNKLAAIPAGRRREPETGWISSKEVVALYQSWLELPETSYLRRRAEELLARARAREEGQPMPEFSQVVRRKKTGPKPPPAETPKEPAQTPTE